MDWFFAKKEARDRAHEIMKKWEGTPYHHMGADRAGMDCTKLMGKIMIDLGTLKQLIPDLYYTKDWYIHGDKEVVLNTFEEHLRLYQVEGFELKKYHYTHGKSVLLFGDFLGFAIGKKGLVNHTAFYLNSKQMYHVINKSTAQVYQYSKTWESRLKIYYRIFRK